jgi:acetyl-CoA synthetase
VTSATWQPTIDDLQTSRLLAFCRHVGQPDPPALDKAAREDPGWFWTAVADWLDLDWQTEPTAAFDQITDPATTRWFPDGALNLADNAVDRWIRRGRGDRPALVWQTEAGDTETWTYTELAVHVDRVGRGLLDLGVVPGDRIGIQLPMVAEAVVAQLACAKIGAVTVPVFSGFGPGAVTERLRLAGAVAHIVASDFPRRGRTVRPLATLANHLVDLPHLRHLITVPVDPGTEPVAVTAPGVMTTSWYDLGQVSKGPLPAATCPTDHPLLIAFTSGTTGRPKGVVLGHAGFAVKAGSDAAFSFDIGERDVATWITDPGWIMSPITVLGGLIAGSVVAVYGGAVDYPGPGRLWQVVRDLGVTMLGVSPTLVRTLMAAEPGPRPDLGRLRVFASSGEPWTPDAYSWLFDTIGGGRLPIINYSGGTEVSGAILSNTTCQPIEPCGFAGPLPGMAADIVDADGNHLDTGIGELALRAPSPGMPLTFWGEHDRYRATYWQRWPNTWHHGDWVEVDNDGTWYIRGRSDDTLKVAGKRLGPAEVESLVNSVPGISESAAIGVPDPVKGEAVVVFARPDTGTDPDDLRAAIVAAVVAGLGKPLTPKAVLLADQLPRTRSGKILRRVIKAVHLGQQPGDMSSLDDIAALDAIKEAR